MYHITPTTASIRFVIEYMANALDGDTSWNWILHPMSLLTRDIYPLVVVKTYPTSRRGQEDIVFFFFDIHALILEYIRGQRMRPASWVVHRIGIRVHGGPLEKRTARSPLV